MYIDRGENNMIKDILGIDLKRTEEEIWLYTWIEQKRIQCTKSSNINYQSL